ncbi:MAG: hypothetical protein NUV90_03280 [Candidatus Parcubacteria bacterium]|nr:hypothetical protein [Candidatus Parcubacteria bacterium]
MQTNNQPPAHVIEFMSSIAMRLGPANAIGLLKDAQLTALRRILVEELGVSDEKIEKIMEREMKKTAQNVIKTTSVPSPYGKIS